MYSRRETKVPYERYLEVLGYWISPSFKADKLMASMKIVFVEVGQSGTEDRYFKEYTPNTKVEVLKSFTNVDMQMRADDPKCDGQDEDGSLSASRRKATNRYGVETPLIKSAK